jgi:CheB methylesterase
VIAPNTTLTIEGGVLHLRRRDPAERPHRPVDAFFHSLAQQRGPNAIGIILSGNGSDGVDEPLQKIPAKDVVFRDLMPEERAWVPVEAGGEIDASVELHRFILGLFAATN